MAEWDFQFKARTELFQLMTADAPAGVTKHFDTDGRRVWYDEAAGLVMRDNAMFIMNGELEILVENQDPVVYRYDDFEWDETGKMGNTNPFPYPRQVYPTGAWMDLTPGAEGTQWVCFMPHDNRQISYEAYRGNHMFRFQEDNLQGTRTGYMVVLRGHACMAGLGECEEWKVYEFPPRSSISMEGDPDSIVFYVWERQ